MALPTYVSSAVTVSWAGYSFQDFAPDSFVVLKRNSDITDEESGADSNVAISFLPDETGMAEFTFQQGSQTDSVLSGVLEAQRANQQLVKGDIVVNDPSGSVLARLVSCHIKTYPEIDLGSSATGKSRKYVFFVEKFEIVSQGAGVSGDLNTDVAAGISTLTSLLG